MNRALTPYGVPPSGGGACQENGPGNSATLLVLQQSHRLKPGLHTGSLHEPLRTEWPQKAQKSAKMERNERQGVTAASRRSSLSELFASFCVLCGHSIS